MAVVESNLPALKLLSRGKVRDVYAVDEHSLLFAATDRLSAFDVVMLNVRLIEMHAPRMSLAPPANVLPRAVPCNMGNPVQGVPGKGKILTQLSLFWFELLKDVIGHHVITADINQMPAIVQSYRDQLEGRVMLVKRLAILPIESIVRGYISGAFPLVFSLSA